MFRGVAPTVAMLTKYFYPSIRTGDGHWWSGGRGWEAKPPLSEEGADLVPDPFITNHLSIAIRKTISELRAI
jgi:hypothetical protein